jgi:hypothetical protein
MVHGEWEYKVKMGQFTNYDSRIAIAVPAAGLPARAEAKRFLAGVSVETNPPAAALCADQTAS